MNPVADVVPTRTVRVVRNKRARPGAIPASSCSIAPERCPIMGRCIAASTSGWTSVGPGRKNRPKGGAGGAGGGGGGAGQPGGGGGAPPTPPSPPPPPPPRGAPPPP